MRKLTLPASMAGLSRRVLAAIIAVALVAAGALASVASTQFGDAAGDPAPSGSASQFTEVAASATPDATSMSPSPSPQPEAAAETVTLSENAGGAGGNNLVILNNFRDDALLIRGSIQINRINAPNVAPQNLAQSLASCTDCQTLAVALQINLIGPNTRRAVPANAAVAVNAACVRCTTAARAIQVTLTVDDPMETPRPVRALVRDMGAALRSVAQDAETFDEAWTSVDAVIADFRELAEYLRDAREIETATTTPDPPDMATPTPVPSPSPSPTEGTPSPTPTPTAVPTATVAPNTPTPQPAASP